MEDREEENDNFVRGGIRDRVTLKNVRRLLYCDLTTFL
jgi:hypothetical protein